MTLQDLYQELESLKDMKKAVLSQRFFKTYEGGYAANDQFIGLTVPVSRTIAKKYYDLSLLDVTTLLHNSIHEARLIALVILIHRFKTSDENKRKMIYTLYLNNTNYVNNWDLVDASAEYIVGEYLQNEYSRDSGHPRMTLEKIARSESLWERRIAIVSTFAFIKVGDFEPTFAVADILLHDSHDLIQKAVGWLLREVGKRCSEHVEKEFLKTRYKTMPRTMLRYAIERFPPEERKKYLQSKV